MRLRKRTRHTTARPLCNFRTDGSVYQTASMQLLCVCHVLDLYPVRFGFPKFEIDLRLKRVI